MIGIPGDHIHMKEGRPWINGKMVDRKFIEDSTDTDDQNNKVPVKVYMETLPNGVQHLIQEISDDQPLDNTGEYVVPPGHYFMMGDNRDRSADSRILSDVGYVPAEDLEGKAEFRFFSIDDSAAIWQIWKWPLAIRYSRLLTPID